MIVGGGGDGCCWVHAGAAINHNTSRFIFSPPVRKSSAFLFFSPVRQHQSTSINLLDRLIGDMRVVSRTAPALHEKFLVLACFLLSQIRCGNLICRLNGVMGEDVYVLYPMDLSRVSEFVMVDDKDSSVMMYPMDLPLRVSGRCCSDPR